MGKRAGCEEQERDGKEVAWAVMSFLDPFPYDPFIPYPLLYRISFFTSSLSIAACPPASAKQTLARGQKTKYTEPIDKYTSGSFPFASALISLTLTVSFLWPPASLPLFLV